MATKRVRADELLVQQGLAESRSKAKALIIAGEVRAGDRAISKPAELLDGDLTLELREKLPFVSRGGIKLAAALDQFTINVNGSVAADIGASTGGFTDVLLQRGAQRVYAIDVGYGQLDYRLRGDPRVVVMERVNARYLESLPEPIEFISVDVSFISLEHMLPVMSRLLAGRGDVVMLIKPQFEAGRDAVSRGGVVRDPRTRRNVVERVVEMAPESSLHVHGLLRSPITGPAGNVEYLAWLRRERARSASQEIVEHLFSKEVRAADA